MHSAAVASCTPPPPPPVSSAAALEYSSLLVALDTVLLPYVSPTALMHSGPVGMLLCIYVTRAHPAYTSLFRPPSHSPSAKNRESRNIPPSPKLRREKGGGGMLYQQTSHFFVTCDSILPVSAVCVSSGGACVLLLRLLPRCCRCSSLATAEGVCYEPSCFARARLLLILGYALPTNISLLCDLGCGKKSPPAEHRLLVETPNFKRPQDPKTLFRNTFILSPSAHTHSHRAHHTTTTSVPRGRNLPPRRVLLSFCGS